MPSLPEAPPPGTSTLRVTADLVAVRDLAAHLRTACEGAGVPEMTTFELELALVEAANNICEHGYGACEPGTIDLALALHEDRIELTLSDTGQPVPAGFFEGAALPKDQATCGRGAAIIQACTDTLTYETRDGVNQLLLTKALTS